MALSPLLLSNFDTDDFGRRNDNACFGNAIVQILRHIPQFLRRISESTASVERALQIIFNNIGTFNRASICELRILVGQHSNQHQFYSGTQEDAMEFFTHLMNSLEASNSTFFNFNTINYIQFYNAASACRHCGTGPQPTTDTQNILQLALQQTEEITQSLSQLIHQHLAMKYSDEGCGKRCLICCTHGDSSDHQNDIKCVPQPYVYQKRFTTFPPFLLIQLKRFKHKPDNTMEKINTLVTATNTIVIQATKYNLLATLDHHQSKDGTGHYKSNLKTGNRWYTCNDASMPQYIPEINVLEENMYTYVFKKAEPSVPHSSRAAPSVSSRLPHSSRAAPSVSSRAESSVSHSSRADTSVSSRLPHSSRAKLSVPHSSRADTSVSSSIPPHASRPAPATSEQWNTVDTVERRCHHCHKKFKNLSCHLTKNKTCQENSEMQKFMIQKKEENKYRRRKKIKKNQG